MNERKNEQTNEQTSERTNRRTHARTHGRTNGGREGGFIREVMNDTVAEPLLPLNNVKMTAPLANPKRLNAVH